MQNWQHDLGSGGAAVSISDDGTRIIAGALGKTVICLNDSGQELWSQKVGNQAWRTAISQDGETIITGAGSTRPWDMKGRGLYCFNSDGALRWQKDLAASIWGLAISADGSTIAAGTSAKELLVLDNQGSTLFSEKIPGIGWYAWVWDASLSADGEIIAAGSADKHLRILTRDGKLIAKHSTQADVFATAVSANGQIIAGGDSSGQVYCLDNKGNLLWQQLVSKKVWAVALSKDGQQLLVGADKEEGHIQLYNQSGQFLGKRHVDQTVTNVAMSADGQRFIIGTRTGGIFIFDQNNVLHTDQAQKIVRDVAISAEGNLAAAVSEDGRLYTYHLPPLILENAGSEFANRLFEILKQGFNLEEIKTLAFQLGVQHDDLAGETREAKARELILFMDRKNRLDELWKQIQEIRPDLV